MYYASGLLSSKEKDKLENHLLFCEKCITAYRDALNAKDDSETEQIISHLFDTNYKAKKIIKRPNRKAVWICAFVTGSLIVSYAGYIEFFNQPSASTNLNTSNSQIGVEPELKHPESGNNQILASTEEVKTSNISSENENELIVPENNSVEIKNEPEKTPDKNPLLPVSELNKDSKEHLIPENKIPAAKTPDKEKEQNKKPDVKPSVEATTDLNIDKTNQPPPTKLSYKEQVDAIFKLVDESKFNEALIEIEKILSKKPGDISAKYYRGFVFYQLQQNENALADFDWVLKKKNSRFYEEARWYTILILNRLKRFSESKSLLAEVVSGNGTYSFKAKQLLELMGD